MRNFTAPLRSPALLAAAVYALGGAGFAGANLILARIFTPVEYAVFALTLAIINFSSPVAPLGHDGVILRRNVPLGPALMRRTFVAAIGMATFAVAVGGLLYQLSPVVLLLLFLAVLAGGMKTVAMAVLQSRQRFALSLPLSQSPNIVLLGVAALTALVLVRQAWVALALFTGLAVVIGAVAILALPRDAGDQAEVSFGWREPLAYAGAHVGLLLLVQLDRLIIPHVLPLEELARYAVVAAVVGSAFRVLQMGVGHTLIPRLRAASGPRARWRLMRQEGALVGAILLVASATLWYLTPPLVHMVVGDKYHLPPFLILAVLITGIAKVLGSFTRAPTVALGTESELVRLNLLGWASVLVGIAGGSFGSQWGLAGVILGVSLGWWVGAIASGAMSLRHLRSEARIVTLRPELPAVEDAVQGSTE